MPSAPSIILFNLRENQGMIVEGSDVPAALFPAALNHKKILASEVLTEVMLQGGEVVTDVIINILIGGKAWVLLPALPLTLDMTWSFFLSPSHFPTCTAGNNNSSPLTFLL